MDEHPNVTAVRRLYDALTARDVSFLAESLADTIYVVPGDNIIAGTYKGAQETLGLLAKSQQLTDGTLMIHPHDVVGGAKHVVGLDRVTAKRGDKRLDMTRCLVAHVVDGKPAQIWVVVNDQYTFDEFWS
jgi:ketosteroid isomerase-like protein